MNLEKIPLKTVRQFFIQDVALTDYEEEFTAETPQATKKVEDLCYAKARLQTAGAMPPRCCSPTSTASFDALPDVPQVMEMLDEAERERIGCPLTPEKPLVRLRVRWSCVPERLR